MRKFWIILCLVMVFSLAACGGSAEPEPAETEEPAAASETVSADFDAGTVDVTMQNLAFQVPASWRPGDQTDSLLFYYPTDGGDIVLGVDFETYQTTRSVATEATFAEFIGGMATSSSISGFTTSLQEIRTNENGLPYGFAECQYTIDNIPLNSQIAAFDCDGGIMAFNMMVKESSDTNYFEDFQKVLDSVRAADQAPAGSQASGFHDGVLETQDLRFEITDWKVIPAGQTGNEYGDKPVIAFWYNVTNISGKQQVTPMASWITMFQAFQDTDPNLVNELSVAALPDAAFLETQLEQIKPGCTAQCACAYYLDSESVPVVLKAGGLFGGPGYGEQTFDIAQ